VFKFSYSSYWTHWNFKCCGVYNKGLWYSWSCDLRHVQRKHSCSSWKCGPLVGRRKHHCLCSDSMIPLNDSASLHTAQQTWNLLLVWLGSVGSDPTLQKHWGHHFTYDEDVKHATVMWLIWQGWVFCVSRIDKLVTSCDKCINHEWGCAENNSVTSDTFFVLASFLY